MTSAILLVIATGVYTVSGGLAAVIYTDLFQAFILIGGPCCSRCSVWGTRADSKACAPPYRRISST